MNRNHRERRGRRQARAPLTAICLAALSWVCWLRARLARPRRQEDRRRCDAAPVAPGRPAGSFRSQASLDHPFSGRANVAIPLLRVGGRGRRPPTSHSRARRVLALRTHRDGVNGTEIVFDASNEAWNALVTGRYSPGVMLTRPTAKGVCVSPNWNGRCCSASVSSNRTGPRSSSGDGTTPVAPWAIRRAQAGDGCNQCQVRLSPGSHLRGSRWIRRDVPFGHRDGAGPG